MNNNDNFNVGNKASEKSKADQNGKKRFKYDIIALILCFIAAFGVWLFVMNTNQAVSEKKIVVTVNVAEQVKNATGLDIISEKNDMDYRLVTVELTVSGKKSAIDKFTEKDIKITIKDLDQIEAGDKRALVFDDPSLPSEDITLVQMSPAYISSVLIDEVTELEVNVRAEYEGGVQEGKLESLKTGKVDPKSGKFEELGKIRVKGPKSIISAVEEVIVNVNIASYQKSSLLKSKTFEFIDVSGVPLKDNYISVEPSEVDVQVIVSYENKNVPINVTYVADDKDKYNYKVEILYKDGNDAPMIPLTGNSEYFPDALKYDLGNITALENGSYEFVKDSLEIPNGLEFGTDVDWSREIHIIITKTEINPGASEEPDGPSEDSSSADSSNSADEKSPEQ